MLLPGMAILIRVGIITPTGIMPTALASANLYPARPSNKGLIMYSKLLKEIEDLKTKAYDLQAEKNEVFDKSRVEIDGLRAEIVSLNGQCNARGTNLYNSLEQFSQSLSTAIAEGILSREDACNIADNAGIDHPKSAFTVTFTVEIIVQGVMSDSEEHAIQEAQGELLISCEVNDDSEFSIDIIQSAAFEE